MSRYEDAMPYLHAALIEEPDDGEALSLLAICQSHIEPERQRSLETIETAIVAEPDEPEYLRIRALILCQLNRPKEGLATVQTALQMDPADPDIRVAEARVFLCLSRWEEAGISAREALKLDPDHVQASNVLVHALYELRDGGANQSMVLRLLAERPEDAHAHYNAGYSYLQSGDCDKSLEHFTECLRLDPSFDPARIGMMEAMRGRYAIYRLYLRVYFAADARAKKLKSSEVLFPLAVPFLGAAALVHALASFFLLFDPHGRLVMDREESLLGLLGGGGFLAGTALLVLGSLLGFDYLWKSGLTLVITVMFAAVWFSDEIPDKLRM